MPYIRPYGPNAPWNIPVANLAHASNEDSLTLQLWNNSRTERPNRDFNIFNPEYTYPVYEVTDNTPYYPVNDINNWGNLDGEWIPFDPSWEPAPGSDAQMIILDPDTGREWNLWQVDFDGSTVHVSNGNLVPGSYFTKEDGFSPSRGCGIQYLAMLVRPEEVAEGVIRHALSMPILQPSGTEYTPPATKIEHPEYPAGIPEGTRYSLDVTDAEIDAHIASFPGSVSDTTKASIRIIIVAMRDYGWFITDTAGGIQVQLEALESAWDEWADLGLLPTLHDGRMFPRDALDGLMTEARLRAYVPSDEYEFVDPPVDPPVEDRYDEGYEDGYNEGHDEGHAGGFLEGVASVQGDISDAYADGFADGRDLVQDKIRDAFDFLP